MRCRAWLFCKSLFLFFMVFALSSCAEPESSFSTSLHHAARNTYMTNATEVADFSAQVASTPLVRESEAMILIPRNKGLSGSVWANEDKIMAAVFNGTESPQRITLQIDSTALKKYGYTKVPEVKFTVLDLHGKVRSENSFMFKKLHTDFVIKGRLAPKELLLIED